MRYFRLCIFVALCGLLAGGCFFAPGIPDGYYVCSLQSDCPTGMACSLTLGRCIKKEGTDGGTQPCSPSGTTRVCYSGPEGTAGVGSCRPGTQVCQGGFWTACEGEVLPAKETCNNADDDCDGQVDNGCPCKDGTTRSCYPGPQGTLNQGSCRAGTQSCKGQSWGPCENFVGPQAEACDGQDNDCNGKVDDVPSRRCYTGPPPSLGRGQCKAGSQACQNGQWTECVGQVLPRASEICGNQVDDNCNGLVDDGCGCTPGQAQECYGGPPGTRDKGSCRGGRQVCGPNSQWGTCSGQVLPQPEDCNGRDDDCNGQVDDGVTARACYTGPPDTNGKGICKAGSQACQRGQWSTCQGQVLPQAEACDNIDNNCDGNVDEGCDCTPGQIRECYSGPPQTKGVGGCKNGQQKCDGNRQWSACVGEVLPQKEACDNIDNDCDGNIDGFSQRCYTGKPGTDSVGQCRAGAQTCQGGKWSMCAGEVLPSTEICDGKDNDCDGKIDGLARPCYSGTTGCTKSGDAYQCSGRCKSGNETCQNGQWSSCAGEVNPIQELCNNQDDDCDGKIDDFTEDCYTVGDGGCTPDGKGGFRCKGLCATGKRQCSNGNYSICTGQTSKQPESCDGKDNNCDGQIDEGCDCIAGQTRTCYSGPTGTEGKGECKSGNQKCNQFGKWDACIGEATPQTETCNGKDDDCDGQIDGMTQTCYTGPAASRGKSPCRDGIQTCNAGTFGPCTGEIVPKTETCNGIDDDCNGKVDDNLVAPKCPKQQGVCVGSVQRCGGAQGYLPCAVADYGADYEVLETSCDGKDNDCDGQVDGVGACGKCILSTQAPTFSATPPTSCKATDSCYDHCIFYNQQLYYCRQTQSGGFKYTTYSAWISDCSAKNVCHVSTCGSQNFFCDGSRWREGNKPGTNDDFCDGLDNNCDGKIDEDCTCQSPCTAAQYCKAPCTQCVQQAGSPFPICVP